MPARTVQLEARMLDICIRYLLLHDIGAIALFSEEQLAIEELPQECDLFDDSGVEPSNYDPYCTWEVWEDNMIRYDPTERGFGKLLVYASCYWIQHFGAVPPGSLRLGDVEALCQAGSVRLQNWIEQNRRPDCTIKPRFVFDSSLYDPLSITALYGSEAMLRYMIETSDFESGAFLPHPAKGAADQILQWGDLPRLQLLWERRIGYQIQNLGFFRLILRQWCDRSYDKHRPGWDVVFDLVHEATNLMVTEKWGNNLLCAASRNGCMPIIRRLMDRAQQQEELRAELLDESRPGIGPLGEAVLEDHPDVVEYLLRQQGITAAYLQRCNAQGESILHLASRRCNPTMFQHLVPRFFESGMHQRGNNSEETVLARIMMSPSALQDRYESMRILLSSGIDSNDDDDRFEDRRQEALLVAERLGDGDMCRLLGDG